MLRHGESEDNLAKLIAGHRQIQLTEKGRQQARDAANGAPKFDRIIASPLKRAHQTAIEFAQASGFEVHKIELDDRLKERGYGVLEGTLKEKIDFEKLEETEGVESLEKVAKRVRSLFDELKVKEEAILLVTHNGPVRIMHLFIDGTELKDIEHSKRYPNAELIKLDINQ